MKRKLSMTLAIILAATSFAGCEENQGVTPIQPTTEIPHIVEHYQDEQVLQNNIAEIEEELSYEITDKIEVNEDVEIEVEETLINIDEKNTINANQTKDEPLKEEVIVETETEIISILTITDPDTGDQSTISTATPLPSSNENESNEPPPTGEDVLPITPKENIDYKIRINMPDDKIFENAKLSVSMDAIYPPGIVPNTAGTDNSSRTIKKEITKSDFYDFSIPDMRTISDKDYKLSFVLELNFPFSITTETGERIPSRNGSIYTSSTALGINIDTTDIFFTIIDESSIPLVGPITGLDSMNIDNIASINITDENQIDTTLNKNTTLLEEVAYYLKNDLVVPKIWEVMQGDIPTISTSMHDINDYYVTINFDNGVYYKILIHSSVISIYASDLNMTTFHESDHNLSYSIKQIINKYV